MNWLFVFILVATSAHGKTIDEKVSVRALSFDPNGKDYVVIFFEKAAYYRADQKFFKCLNTSIKQKKQITISYDPIKLVLSNCSE